LRLIAAKSQVDASLIKPAIDLNSITKRRRVCFELLDTERNYVNILNAIMSVFADPLRQHLAEQVKAAESDPLKNITPAYLDKTELDVIFGKVPALVQVHQQIFKELENLIETKWEENCRIGKVFLKHVSLVLLFILFTIP
jgi:hypothetical protein